ncbi:hypothetical protein V502_11514 [Pseudogymnoascus sp. VKM F-4520 (FW-2644)]|nr:hypothetical protein V502_11514 [Pseudogymnoascus sp. VKM F-4520 (FW-2644)]
MSDKIIFDVKVEEASGRIHISNIRHSDGSPVKIHNTLDIAFKSPPYPDAPLGFYVKSDPWVEFETETTSTKIDESTVAVTARLTAPEPLTITDTFTIGINVPGDPTGDTKRFTESIVLTVAKD